MRATEIEEHDVWIVNRCIHVVWTVLTATILYSEIHQRVTKTISFTTKSLKWCSITCIVAAFLAQLFELLGYLPGFCTFYRVMCKIFSITTILFMGYFQLSRLHYCFANAQIHSDKGYTKLLFIIMFIIGGICSIVFIVSWMFIPGLPPFYTKCGYNTNYDLYRQPLITPSYNEASYILISIVFIALLWHFSILYLYIRKVKQFHESTPKADKKGTETVYKRVRLILHKITTLTLFYLFIGTCSITALTAKWSVFGNQSAEYSVANAIWSGTILSYSLTMYLMMDHNKNQYFIFVKAVYWAKLHWICCCYRYIITDQLEGLDENVQNIALQLTQSNKNQTNFKIVVTNANNRIRKSSIWQTADGSIDDHRISAIVNLSPVSPLNTDNAPRISDIFAVIENRESVPSVNLNVVYEE